ncbi:MAG: hypothetical protein V4543_08955 [Bacteroidota bacterium]
MYHPHHHNLRSYLPYGAGDFAAVKPHVILKNVFREPEEADWVLRNIMFEGPPHKQLRTSLLIKEAGQLLDLVSELTGNKPDYIKGIPVFADMHHTPQSGFLYPLELPVEVLNGIHVSAPALNELGMGAPHDVLRDLLLLAVLRNAIEILTASPATQAPDNAKG